MRVTRPRVLIVDDEPSICRALEIALGRSGYDPVIAFSAEAAYKHIRRERIDVLVLDLRIPDERGDVVYGVAVSEQPHLATHTIFMTGDITEKADELIEECGCPLIRKPFDLRDVLAAIGSLAPIARESSA